jgi:hypothetical protein
LVLVWYGRSSGHMLMRVGVAPAMRRPRECTGCEVALSGPRLADSSVAATLQIFEAHERAREPRLQARPHTDGDSLGSTSEVKLRGGKCGEWVGDMWELSRDSVCDALDSDHRVRRPLRRLGNVFHRCQRGCFLGGKDHCRRIPVVPWMRIPAVCPDQCSARSRQ